jgi:hypothetical protein
LALIAGYVADRPQPTETLQQRVRTFLVVPGESSDDYVHQLISTRFGHLIVKHKSTYPIKPQIVSDDEGNVLVILGFILSGCVIDLLNAAVREGAGAVDESEGEFVAVFVEGSSGAVHIINDRFSSRPFYILRRNDGVYFSSNLAFLLTLAGVSYRPDVAGWLEVCAIGHTIGSRTTADGIERLRPATHLTISPGRVSAHQYWHLAHSPDPSLDPVGHSTEVFRAFRSGAERRARLAGRGVLALSGGLDSRLVAGALPKGTEYSAFTFIDIRGADATPQTRAAAAVAMALGLRHRIAPLPTSSQRSSVVIALTGGMRAYQHMANVMSYVDELKRLDARFLLGGGPGDVLAGSYIPSPAYLDATRTSECIEHACRQRAAAIRDATLIFRDEVVAAERQGVQDSLAESFASVTGPTAAHRITAWAMIYRQPAFTFTSVFHTHPDVSEAACHLDYNYSNLMLTLPASWLYRRRFYAYMIHAALPQLRHIPYANTGQLLCGQPPTHDLEQQTWGRRAAELMHSFSERVVRRLRPTPAASMLFGHAELLDEVQERMHSFSILKDTLDLARCDDLLDRTRAGRCPSEEILGVLVSLTTSATALPKEPAVH